MTSKILLVDDEPTLRQVLAQLLGDAGFEVHQQDSAEAALRQAAERPYPLLIVDKNLPATNGIDLAATLLQHRRADRAIMITGYPSVRSLVEACNAGISGYLIKPFANLDTLLAEVQRVTQAPTIAETAPSPRLILAWLSGDEAARSIIRSVQLEINDPQLGQKLSQHIKRYAELVGSNAAQPDLVIGDQFENLFFLLQQRPNAAGLYLGPSLGFQEILALMHRGGVAVATAELLEASASQGQLQ